LQDSFILLVLKTTKTNFNSGGQELSAPHRDNLNSPLNIGYEVSKLAIRLRERSVLIYVFLFAVAHLAFSEGTRTWEQSKFDDLSKGTAAGVAIRSTGGLELAAAVKALSTTPSTYIWSVAADQGGNLYAATGAPARVYRITPQGQSTTIFEPQELQVQALAVDKNGVLYAATNPDGKVYRIERVANISVSHAPASKAPAGKEATEMEKGKSASEFSASIFFDPRTKYIWDLIFDSAGNLYVATGDHGEIFRVATKGEHSVFFKSDEAHIRALAMDAKGNLIAGSDGSGLVYQIKPNGEGFVLYSAPKKEITALAIDKTGNIYAAAGGEKRPGTQPVFPSPVPAPTATPSAGPAQSGMVIMNVIPGLSGLSSSIPFPGAGATGGSEIYRIAPDGSPSRVWSSAQDLVYALAFDHAGRLLAGTGNRGHIFAITGEDQFVDLLKASASQVTAFAEAPGGGLYASTSNLGKVFLLGGSPESEGSYESDVFDAKVFSRWGRAEFRGAGNVELLARSGNVDNPDRNWSPWMPVELAKNPVLNVPPARFIQWKAVLHASAIAPIVDSVLLNYLPKNVAPDFDDVTVQVGVRYQALPKAVAVPDTSATAGTAIRFDAPPPSTRDRDSIGVKWTVHDDNDDQMVYSVYYRGDGETRWLLLKDNLTDKVYSFDASLLPDGGYTIEVVASDAPSHSPGQALTSVRDSARFEVDTTPPRIDDLKTSADGGQIHVNFHAADGFSNIKRAEYSVDAGDWQYVEPVGQLADSKTLNYEFQVTVPAGGGSEHLPEAKMSAEHVVVVRVYDRFDNMSSAKTVIRGK
jgi:sugar lactone lactonase YvrE